MTFQKTRIIDSLDFTAQESESRRLVLVATLFFAAACLAILRHMGGSPVLTGTTYAWSLITLAIGVGMCVITWRVTRHANRAGRLLPMWFWVGNLVLELLVPAVCIALQIVSHRTEPFDALSAPVILLSAILIALSVLRLRPRLSLAAGAVAAIVQLGLFALAVQQTGRLGNHGIPYYVSYAVVLAVAGVAAALVSSEVRRYVRSALAAAESQARLHAVEHDLDTARRIQEGLFPNAPPNVPGFDIAGWSKPAESTGGDYYDWLPLEGGRLALVVGDVTGHGIGPAILMAICRAYTRATFPSEHGIQPALERLNRLLQDDLGDGRFITFVVALLDPATAEIEVLSAGHGPILLRHSSRGELQIAETEANGLPLGIHADESYAHSVRWKLEPGDTLVMITDGFFEQSRRSDDTQFGINRLRNCILTNPNVSASQLIQTLHNEVLAFAGDQPQLDDMTAVVVRRLSLDAPPTVSHEAGTSASSC